MSVFLRFMPILCALFSLAVFAVSILGYEAHLKAGKTMYVRLAPLDPRSILQGDYMQLRYYLDLHDLKKWDVYIDERIITAYVKLDDDNMVRASYLEPSDFSDGSAFYKLKLNNSKKHQRDLFPAVNSFMFAEGLGECYERAEFAKLSVLDDGSAMLVDLVGTDFKSLECESNSKSSWANPPWQRESNF